MISVDGSYTNETVLKKLPANTILIGRIRKDCSLYLPPEPPTSGKGRKKSLWRIAANSGANPPVR
ncbi:hypothetical protein [Algoriphagus boritolerans]|uniref:hypothetical protein n=1 Tax=Algoriphagus boritolerans TaxID=308111 RepID=UPI002FCE1785